MNTRTITTIQPLTLKNGKKTISGARPEKMEHKLFITQTIDETGSGYLFEIGENDYFNNVIVVSGDHITQNNTRSEYGELFDNICRYVTDSDALYYSSEDIKTSCPDRDYKTMREAVADLLGVEVTAYKAGQVRQILNKKTSAYYMDYYSENERAAELLSVLTPYTWTTETIRGYVQRDWATIIYPKELYGAEDVQLFEAFYFGMYSDYVVKYCDLSVSIFIPDYIVWDTEKLITECLNAVGLPDNFDRKNVVIRETA